MDVQIRELTDKKAVMVVKDTTPTFMNSLRRVLMTDIPKMAIDDVEFHMGSILSADEDKTFESVSPLFDEIIAHRLGLVPIPTDLGLFVPRDQCVCGGEGCPNCTIMYTLNKKGPATVYSGDLEPLGGPEFAIDDDLIPIVKLADHQALLIYATAILGTGDTHSKWQVVSGAGYKYYPEVEIDPALCTNEGDCVKACPRKVFMMDDDDKVRVDPEREEDCILCMACIEVCEPARDSSEGGEGERSAVSVKDDENSFIFRFETDGSLSASDALLEACKRLEVRYAEFRDAMGELEG
jgi:DNA-directed RNA polymerase subunit D